MEEFKPEKLLFDDVLRTAGGTGRWQLYKSIWISKIGFSLAFFMLSMIFLGHVPDHRCADGYPADTSFEELPEEASQCIRVNGTCARWVYDTADMTSTMATEWNLVCNRRTLLALIQSLSMAGGLIGAVLSGPISDRFGRRPTVLVGSAVYIIGMWATVAAGNLYVVFILRVITGLGSSFAIIPTVVIIMEILTPEWRMLGGLLLQVPYAFGVMLLAGLAYLIPVWWQLQIAISVPALLHVLDYWFLPESPRWLVMSGRLTEAAVLLQKIGDTNGSPLSDKEKLLDMLAEVHDAEVSQQTSGHAAEVSSCKAATGSLWRLVRTPRIRTYTIATFIIWLVSGMSYYGLAFEVGQLSKNLFAANCLSGLLEVPACLLPWFTATRWGRRPTTIVYFLLGAITIIPAAFTKNHRLLMGLGLTGKFAVTGAFCLVYIYTPEYMPTTVRTLGQSAASLAARLGSIVAPFIIESGAQLHPAFPTVLFGSMCVLAAALALLLPETAGRRLPETVAAVELGAWRFESSGQSEKLGDLLRPGRRAKKDDTDRMLKNSGDFAALRAPNVQ